MRDITERGRDLEQVLTQYMTFVKPAFEEFCSPVSTNFCSTMNYTGMPEDLNNIFILPCNRSNSKSGFSFKSRCLLVKVIYDLN